MPALSKHPLWLPCHAANSCLMCFALAVYPPRNVLHPQPCPHPCSLSSFMCSLKYNFLREAFRDHLISYCICRPLSYVLYSSIFSPKPFLCSFAGISPFCTLPSNLNEISRKARVFLQAISRSLR